MAELKSARFAGDPALNQVLNGTLRLGAVGTPPFPAPVLSDGPAIAKVQQALMDIGFPLPEFGADSSFGAETGQAVVAFKRDWHLVPVDPVVGPKTMDALDRELIARERGDRPAPPVPPPAPPLDPYGRTAAGAARVPGALAATAAFGATGLGSPWLSLSRAVVAAGIAERITNPDGAQQGGNGLCTTAAFINVWAQDAPDSYAAFATTLFNTGAANIAPNQGGGGLRIAASAALAGANYDAIAQRMTAKRFPVPSQADWMVMSAIRDSSNRVFKFTGDPDDWVSHNLGDGASPFGDLDGWLRNASAWNAVTEDTSLLLSASVAEAMRLEPQRSRCLLNIDVAMLMNDSGRHTAVLRSPITQTADGHVLTFKLWTWAGIMDVNVARAKFESNYYGANVAFL